MKPIVLSLLVLFAVAFFLRNVFGFLKIMFKAKRPSFRTDQIFERVKGLIIYVFGQKRILKNYTWAGIEHFMLFWGFMIITIGSLELVVLGFVPGFVPGATAFFLGAILSMLILPTTFRPFSSGVSARIISSGIAFDGTSSSTFFSTGGSAFTFSSFTGAAFCFGFSSAQRSRH